MPLLCIMHPLEQKYKSAYYTHVGSTEHYMMFEGIRTRHSSEDEALRLCEETNRRHNLPNINVRRSSSFNTQKGNNHVS